MRYQAPLGSLECPLNSLVPVSNHGSQTWLDTSRFEIIPPDAVMTGLRQPSRIGMQSSQWLSRLSESSKPLRSEHNWLNCLLDHGVDTIVCSHALSNPWYDRCNGE